MTPNDDLISRTAALDAIDNERKMLIEQNRLGAEHVVVHNARRLIEDLPAVDAAPVVPAHWVKTVPGDGWPYCSNCKWGALTDGWMLNAKYMKYHFTDYCPHCGAKMDKKT